MLEFRVETWGCCVICFSSPYLRAERERGWIDPGLGRMRQQGVKSSDSCYRTENVDLDERFSAL